MRLEYNTDCYKIKIGEEIPVSEFRKILDKQHPENIINFRIMQDHQHETNMPCIMFVIGSELALLELPPSQKVQLVN